VKNQQKRIKVPRPLRNPAENLMSNDPPTRTIQNVMIIEDDPKVTQLLEQGLKQQDRIIYTCSSCEDAFVQIEKGFIPGVILLDLTLPGMDGLSFLSIVRKQYPFIKAIVISADDGVDTIVEAMRLGSLDFIPKPFKLQDVRVSVNEALQYRHLQMDLEKRTQRALFNDEIHFLYTSKPMAEVMETIQRVAATTVPVLITGESGVGKELVAREIHQRSDRTKGPFVKVNCAALPPNLLEGELFGFEKGAFTGAVKSKPAKFERADNGTLFLDEIGDLEHGLQAKLLHVLQDGTFTRLGSNKTIKSRARIVVATNRNMEEAVNLGHFRSDLYYRLNVIRVHVPPLRERPSDIMLLADHFLEMSNQKFGKNVEFDDETRQYILHSSWPGNVRELQNAVSRYVVLGKLGSGFELESRHPGGEGQREGHTLPEPEGGSPVQGTGTETEPKAQIEDLPHEHDGMTLKEISRNAARNAERKAILAVLKATRWNKSQAAKMLKISYKALLYKIKDCNIERHDA
jgi:two-component system response regulator AtoC